MKLERRLESFGAEKIFVALFLFFGAIICFMRPPYQLMDEINHLPRVWQISQGIFFSPTMELGEFINGDHRSKKIFTFPNLPADVQSNRVNVAEMPTSLLPDDFITDANRKHYVHAFDAADVKNFLATPLNPEDCDVVLIPNTGVYLPPAYFPQAFAAWLGRLLNLTAGEIFYAMGLSGLMFAAACLWLAMKFLPEAKTLIFVLAMTPMFLLEAASTSADCVTFGVCLAATAWLLSLRLSTEKFSRAEIFALIILSAMIACCKSVYGTILLLYFLIPPERVGSLKKFLLTGAALVAVNLLVSIVWTELAVNAAGVELYTNRYLGYMTTDAAAQKVFVAEHPEKFFAAMANSLEYMWSWYLSNFIGSWGFLWNVSLPPMFYLLYTMTLLAFAVTCGVRVRPVERLVLLTAALVSTTAFFLVHYLKWSAVGGDVVNGVQGRYFVPLGLMIFVALSTFKPMPYKNSIALVAGTVSGCVMLAANFYAFY